jgi:glycolate oxidase iron-sulfur subunit
MNPLTPNSVPHLQLDLDKLKSCIHCGMCLPACPTYRVTGSEAESPRGRLYLMKKLLDGNLTPDAVEPHLDQCLACHNCETVCPSGVQYGQILMSTRQDLVQRKTGRSRQLKRFIFQKVLPNATLMRLGRNLLRFYQWSGLQWLVRKTDILKRFPYLQNQETLLPAVPQHKPLKPGKRYGNPAGETVALLTGCAMDVFYNPIHWDTVEVLVANGYQVIIPEQTCCGALAHHAGEIDITRELARLNVDDILASNPSWIVLNSAGCGSTLKDYGHLLNHDPLYSEKSRQFSAKVVDVMELLAKKPLAKFKNYALYETITYHAACHLYHVQKVQSEPISLLAQVPGINLVPLQNAETCCGSAGIYNIEQPELSAEILENKMQNLKIACEGMGATTVVTGNPGCLLQLEHGVKKHQLPMRVRHPISILADGYRDPQTGGKSS